jgi:hypothetical protein
METTDSISPSSKFVAVTPSDTLKLTYNGIPTRTKAIYVGGSGNLAIKNDLGTAVTVTGVLAGSIYPFSTDQIMSTNTTCTNLCALF